MTAISTTRKDVIWNYIGTVVSMGSGFILLPFLVHFLSSEELGLWYVYIAVANLAMLFEFGFNPTFARNIVFVLSGAKALYSEGKEAPADNTDVDWHLLKVVIRTSKIIYACIAAFALILLASAGTVYVSVIVADLNPVSVWVSWSIFVVSIVINLYFLYSTTILRGCGDIEGENKARTFAKVAQLLLSAVLLVAGLGLIGAAIGFLVNALLLRVLSLHRFQLHRDIVDGLASDKTGVGRKEVADVLRTVSHLAWRDGVVGLATYASTQGMSIMSSLFLGLAETGTYSILLQLANAVCNFSCAYPKSFFPAMQAAFAGDNVARQREIASNSIALYWACNVVGAIGTSLVVLPLIALLKPDISINYILFFFLMAYLSLLQQHSIFCSFVISMNEIPYMAGYLTAAVSGVCLVALLSGVMHWGALGIVLGQLISQAVYNNWKWPTYFCGKIGTSYLKLLSDGMRHWRDVLGRRLSARKSH